ncbi:hypothetical protein K3165_01695 [Qipengyuania sp. 1XM1-15A]|uniref:DUF6650 family protein n=1 Tax=Qipengyuania xiamenensis TaxID=2867237 RepID=UPI001C87DEE2|nr:DUF6650 family protein [Qipengyuania xiamenensis]MBX7531632.1 hypothetical protein [Qipengyuania xiamenensis]
MTGFSTPIFGAQWTATESERDIANKLMLYLEDRRVLYNPYYAEDPRHCVESIIDIRSCLFELASKLGQNSVLRKHIRAMRAGAREFMNRLDLKDDRPLDGWHLDGMGGSMDFQDALGRLRSGYGLHLAFVAERFDVKVPEELQAILPPKVTSDD